MTDEPLKSQEEVEAWFEKVRAAFPGCDRPHCQTTTHSRTGGLV